MNTSEKLFTLALVLLLSISFTACDSTTGVQDSAYNDSSDNTIIQAIEDIAPDSLSLDEQESLAFMREEEKVARDAYLHLYNIWGGNVFINIASSEQKHMDAVLTLIERYDLNDPASNLNEGEFNNDDLQDLYDTLIEKGGLSLIDALYVGALIEETDIIDLEKAMDQTDNEDITYAYSRLWSGSVNHLNAFVKNLSKQGITYQPQLLAQEVYDDMIN